MAMEKLGVKMQGTFSVVKPVKEPTNLRCDLCSKTFTRSWLLKNHQRIHTGERPYKCTYCDKAFADKSNLRQHAKIHTTKEKLFECPICQKTFAQRRYLMKHATEIHRDASVCPLESMANKCSTTKSSGPMKYVVQQPEKSVAGNASAKVTMTTTGSTQTAIETRIKKEAAAIKQTVKQKLKDASSTSLDNKDKKYSEQDLKDFIKSNQKTMEKNGYIFIKQNFETLDTDTEPTLTEISEIPVTAIPESLKLGSADLSKSTGNQLLKVNGKMVYLQMENKPATREEILEAAKSVKGSAKGKNVRTETQGKSVGTTVNVKGSGKKIVAKSSYVRRQANILKSNSVRKSASAHESNAHQAAKPVSVPNIVKNVMNAVNPVQLMAMNAPPGRQEPVTYLQVIPQQQERQVIIPLSMVQLNPNITQVLQSPSILTLNNPSVTLQSAVGNLKNNCVNSLNQETSVSNGQENFFHVSDVKPEIVEIQEIHTIDEKGAASELGVGSVVTNTPIVSDAPWQGVLNINSEQELLEYINSQSNTGVETDQGYTILIQNVDTQNGAVLSSSLDTQNILSNSGNLSSVFTDHGTMISDILPVVSNVEESQVHSSTTEDSEIMGSMLSHEGSHINGDDTCNIDANNIIEIRSEVDSEVETQLIGVDQIIKVERDEQLEADMNAVDDHDDDDSAILTNHASDETDLENQGEIILDASTEHLSDQEDSADHVTGQLLIKEESENESLNDVCISDDVEHYSGVYTKVESELEIEESSQMLTE